MRHSWNTFVKRRKIKIERFIKYYNIKTKEDFLKAIKNLNIYPPGDDILNSLFPEALVEADKEIKKIPRKKISPAGNTVVKAKKSVKVSTRKQLLVKRPEPVKKAEPDKEKTIDIKDEKDVEIKEPVKVRKVRKTRKQSTKASSKPAEREQTRKKRSYTRKKKAPVDDENS